MIFSKPTEKPFRRGARLSAFFCILSLCLVLVPSSLFAQSQNASVKFHTLRETVAALLPGAVKLTRRDIQLTDKQLRRLRKHKNWDSDISEFILFHARNEKKQITRTLILFPEHTRQGVLVVAVALSNQGKVVDALLMEAQHATIDWVLPLVRADYMKTFVGKDKDVKLRLSKNFKTSKFPPISQTYALRLINAVKKSAQLFEVLFGKNKSREMP